MTTWNKNRSFRKLKFIKRKYEISENFSDIMGSI